jgi:hypothetical protein
MGAQARRALLTGAACLTFLLAHSALAPAPAPARGLVTGVADGLFKSGDPATRDLWLGRTAAAGAGIIRLETSWAAIAPVRPGQPADPADPEYRFDALDAEIRSAARQGLSIMLTSHGAPSWAEGPGRPAGAPFGSWMPNAAEYGAFGQALARRYSGSFPGPDGLGPLPAVGHFQAWNEPNIATYITPQWTGGSLSAVDIYRGLLNAFYDGVKAVQPGAVVVSAGTSPYGDPPGGVRSRPLEFLRGLLCLKNRKRLKPTPCPVPAKLDVLAHHPINTSGGARTSAIHPDDVSTPDLGEVNRVLKAAERRRTIRPLGRHQLWVTEFWWNSNPPNTARGLNPGRQARAVEESLYLFWKAGASVAINLEIRDDTFDPALPLATSQSGLYYLDGMAKPALTAFRFPLVAERRRRARRGARRTAPRAIVWGKSPATGRMRIEVRGRAGWRPVAKLRVTAGQVFRRRLNLRPKSRLRARINGERSLVWVQR